MISSVKCAPLWPLNINICSAYGCTSLFNYKRKSWTWGICARSKTVIKSWKKLLIKNNKTLGWTCQPCSLNTWIIPIALSWKIRGISPMRRKLKSVNWKRIRFLKTFVISVRNSLNHKWELRNLSYKLIIWFLRAIKLKALKTGKKRQGNKNIESWLRNFRRRNWIRIGRKYLIPSIWGWILLLKTCKSKTNLNSTSNCSVVMPYAKKLLILSNSQLITLMTILSQKSLMWCHRAKRSPLAKIWSEATCGTTLRRSTFVICRIKPHLISKIPPRSAHSAYFSCGEQARLSQLLFS